MRGYSSSSEIKELYMPLAEPLNPHPLYKDYKDQIPTQASLSLISKAKQRAQIYSGNN